MRKTVIVRDFNDIIDHPLFKEWFIITKDVLSSREFQKRKLIKHHDNSVFDHCIRVSFEAYKIAKKRNVDEKACALAGLLHDFYPEAWQYTESLEKLDASYKRRFSDDYKSKITNLHGFVHGRKAMENAYKFYPEIMNKQIENAILRHMFPLTVIPPKYKEGWVITLADKKVSFKAMPKIKEWPKYVGIVRIKKSNI